MPQTTRRTTRTAALVAVALALSAAGCSKSKSNGSLGDAGGSDGSASGFGAVHDALFGGMWNTEGVVVLYNGKLVYEEYGAGFVATMPHITYSASKTMGSALAGIAVEKGLFKTSDSICSYITKPAGADPTLCDTTIENLLQMTSGLSWLENYSPEQSSTDSNVIQMLYGDQTDMGAYAASQPRAAKAGTVWNYSSGDANILSLALKGALKGQDERQWAMTNLFTPAGLSSTVFESDLSGTLVFSSSCFMTPRDMAAFGQLYLNQGMTPSGTQIIPAAWVSASVAPVGLVTQGPGDAGTDAGPGGTGGSYGYATWLNAPSPSSSPDTWMYPSLPADEFSAEGHYGQKIMMFPSQNIVIARTGNDRDPEFDPQPMAQAVLAALGASGDN
jgi:CubicO group peptidase (beta-lactamase class C family)